MKLTQQQLETLLWSAANILRGRTAEQDYKNYILSLMFCKRLRCDDRKDLQVFRHSKTVLWLVGET
jgi:type I restriction-modification system DNA methylase subunit